MPQLRPSIPRGLMNLRQADVDMFAKLGIQPELLERAGVVRVTDREAREEYGIRGSGDMAGLAFPYFEPSTIANGRRRWYVRIRRDNPELEHGRPKKKYVAPYGDRKHLYLPPIPDLFADVSAPIVLVEAEKSAVALTAWCERTGRRLLPIGMGGCYGWRGKVGIQETATGERVPEHDAIPDLVNICRDGRKVFVMFDSNCITNPKVLQARVALVRQLRKQGADVHVLDLPAGEGINGPDDYVGIMGDEALLRVFEGAETGARVLDNIETFLRRFVVMTDTQFIVTTLWIAHTHCFQSFLYTPYLAVTSAEKRCGKSRVLEAVVFLARKPWMTSGASAASLYREIDQEQPPTLLLDEVDRLLKGDKEFAQAVTAVLNAGAHHKGTVSRCVGEGSKQRNKNYRCFCPKAIGGIGSLPDTVADRSILIRMERKLRSQKVERLRERLIGPRAIELRQSLADWIEAQSGAIRSAEPDIPEQLNDRQQDGAESLLAVADVAGGAWPEKSRQALIELYTGTSAEDQSLPTRLLSDIRDVFEQSGFQSFSTKDLLEHLAKIEHGIWAEYHGGKPIGSRSLSKLLGEFGIGPRTTRQGKETFKGYSKEMFSDAWQRYASPSPGNYPSHPSQSNVYAGGIPFSHPSHDLFCDGSRSKESAMFMRVVTDVTDKSGGEGPRREKGVYEDLELPCPVHGRHRLWWMKLLPDGGEMTCGRCEPESGT